MGLSSDSPEGAVTETRSMTSEARSPYLTDEPNVVKVDDDPKRELDAKDVKEQSVSLSDYFRILSYLTTKDRMVLIVALICSMASGIPLPIMNIVFGELVGNFSNYFLPDSTTTESEFKSSISRLSLYIVYLFIAKFVLTYFSMYCFRVTSLRVSAALRLEYMGSLFAQPLSKLDQVSVGTVVNAITTSSNSIQQSISDKLAILFQSLALLIAAYVIAFKYSWALTLATSSAILFILVVCCLTLPAITKIQQKVDKADEKHSAIAAEVFGSIRTVISLGAEAPLATKYRQWVEESRKRGMSMSVVMGLQFGLIFFAMYASYALAFWLGLRLFQQGHIPNINTVITVFFSVMIAVSVLGSIASPLMMVSKAASAAASFFEIIDSERIASGGDRDAAALSSGDIVFKDVQFSYPTRPDTQILMGLNARFERGKTTAIVGPSGSGKSTIVALTERWYSPEQGSISVGQRNIEQLDLKWWRSNIGLVQQEPFLFNDTIFKNVSFGLIGTKWEDEPDSVKAGLVENACKEAFADEFIDRLPKGYETLVGENGTKLSGGQKQRLAIARSIIREPSILILDEATSAIDVRGEKIVQAALDRVSRNRTTIVIAHRLSTVRRADRIIVLRGGLNIEEGTHDELLAVEDGLYRGLVNAQRLEIAADDENDTVETTEALKEELEHYVTTTAEDSQEEAKKTKSSRAQGPFFLLALLGILGAASAYPLQSWLFAKLIDVFSFRGQKLTDAANFWSLWFFVLSLGIAACYSAVGFASSRLAIEMSSTCRTEYFENILKKSVPFYDLNDNASGSLVSRLATDPKQIQDFIGINGVFPVISLCSMIGCIAIAFSFGWKLSLVATFAALPFVFLAAFMRIRYELEFDSMNAAVYSGSSQFAAEAIEAFRTVSALTMEDSILKRYSNLLQDQQKKAFRKAWLATLVFAFSDSVELCAMALTFWYGGQLLASREYEPVSFFVVYMSIILGGQQAGQFFSYGPNIAQGTAAANRMLDFRPDLSDSEKDSEKLKIDTAIRTGAHIEFQKVAFKYASQENPLFTGLDVTIESGQFVAFVGASGCGKTTVISMLERFYDPYKGNIFLNGENITSIDTTSYRRSLSLVAQEPRLFEGTIRDNITLGLDPSEYTDEELVQACTDAEIDDFITSLPEGYSTDLGIKAQTAMSGGQRQRLCIARALLRKPTLLLLDEATSSLDSQSEKLVQGALECLAARRSMTIVAVAHRLATIQKADIIFVFGESQNGNGSKIVERGSHQELLRNKGMYWQMCQANGLDR
ncbi:ABC transporter integral membrane type 1 [Penicillium cf. griseofulvum]|nr:ABC transporter integral membrane type 1 [Penicillium cf. griseofulvum]